LQVATLDGTAACVACDNEQVLIAIVVDIGECGPPSHDRLSQRHETCGTSPKREVLVALIKVEFAVFILVIGDQNIRLEIPVEITDG
jgi:hypothetical protein